MRRQFIGAMLYLIVGAVARPTLEDLAYYCTRHFSTHMRAHTGDP